MEYANPDFEIAAQTAVEKIKTLVRTLACVQEPYVQEIILSSLRELSSTYGRRYALEITADLDLQIQEKDF